MSYLTDENGKPLTKNGKMITAPQTGISDVTINGESIVEDGVAKIAAHKSRQTRNVFGTVIMGVDGDISAYRNTNGEIGYRYLPLNSIDAAVKCAMTDGKGADWTLEEQASARKRMGTLDTQDMIDITEITMDAETLKYVLPSFADYRVLEISFLKTYKATTGLTGTIWLRIAYAVGWSISPSYVYNTFTLDASGKSCIGKSICTNNAQIETNIQGLTVDKKYWNTEFREAPYLLLPNAEWAQYYAECNTVIKVRGIKR